MRKKDERHKIIGGRHRAMTRYSMIVTRLANTDKPKNRAYKGIKLLVGKEEFIEWFTANDFDGCSLDRIDDTGHYSLDNLRLIPMRANIIKSKLQIVNGMMRCHRCKILKPLDEMVSDSRRVATGKTNICKPCDVRRTKR